MADPKWKSLTPVWPEAVIRLSSLIGGNFLDCLLSEELLTHPQYDSLLNGLRKKEPNEDVARELLQILVKTPHPNFDKFRALLGAKIDGGKGFLRLIERRDTPPSLRRDTPPSLMERRDTPPSSSAALHCQTCDETNTAEFVCTECKDHQYYCGDCAKFFQRKGKRKNHAYQDLFPSPLQDGDKTEAECKN